MKNFVNRPFLQSALRELQVFARSPRFWTTFAAVVLIFWVTGPYDTSERLAAAPRLGFWLVIHAAAWSIAVTFAVAADILLRQKIASPFLRMMVGAVMAAPLIGIVTSAISSTTFATAWTMSEVAAGTVSGLVLSALFCLLTWMTMNAEDIRAVDDARLATPTGRDHAILADNACQAGQMRVPLLERLKPENRGTPLHLTVSDHYTEVTTSRGRELVLLRFSDALNELGDVPGLQVHRSHWVAEAHVEALVRDSGRLSIRLKDGRQIPVSRTHIDAVKRRWDGLRA